MRAIRGVANAWLQFLWNNIYTYMDKECYLCELSQLYPDLTLNEMCVLCHKHRFDDMCSNCHLVCMQEYNSMDLFLFILSCCQSFSLKLLTISASVLTHGMHQQQQCYYFYNPKDRSNKIIIPSSIKQINKQNKHNMDNQLVKTMEKVIY